MAQPMADAEPHQDLDLLLLLGHRGRGGASTAADGGKVKIVDVWAHNLEAELSLIRGIFPDHPVVAVTTSPDDASGGYPTAESSYDTFRTYMDRICFGRATLAFTNHAGDLALRRFWRFHVGDFDPDHLRYFLEMGVDVPARRVRPSQLGGALMQYEAIFNPKVTWVTYNGAPDLAFMIKCIFPFFGHHPMRQYFIYLCKNSFPAVYDLKVLAMYGELGGHSNFLMAAAQGGPALNISSIDGFGLEGYRGMVFGLNDGMPVGYAEPYIHPKDLDDYVPTSVWYKPGFGRNRWNLGVYKLSAPDITSSHTRSRFHLY